MSRGIKRKVIAVIIMLCLMLPQLAYAEETSASDKDLEYLRSVMDMIKSKYKGEVSDSQLIEGALKGMFDSMDDYTTYFTPKEAEDFLGEMDGSYQGIGVSISQDGDYIVVGKAFPGSPAERAGIYTGDKIVEAGGKSLIGASSEEAVTLIKGEAGTKVILGIVRSGTSGVIKLEVERAQITINPVSYEIRNGIGYIKLDMFNANTVEYMRKAVDEMDKNKVTKIVLDLRDNPGGEANMAVMTAGMFVPKGLITKLDFKDENRPDELYYSFLEEPKYKLAVLVNKMSASASEILAGAIQDTKAGVLVGTQTFGKAKVQSVFPILTPEAYKKYEEKLGKKITTGEELWDLGINPLITEVIGWTKITTGMYTTPNGRMIDGKGLTPDVQAEDPVKVNNIDLGSIQKLAKTVKPTLNGEGPEVYNTEKILKAGGYEVDNPDSRLDEKTFKAIMKFQSDSGLFSYGTLDFATQQALNDRLDKLILENDKQYAKAVEVLNQ